ncbi:hypothetical protein D9Q98_009651 [Chlorella vulgaris]|uniref:Uncharacterized protein n=1 Tax=Chlorella vulgaris TaxID=3077 RepID=A0A9D4YSC1_CHLVU|nr:hypothetical protein D9Q98_009651 [Chlorella vulgaris]
MATQANLAVAAVGDSIDRLVDGQDRPSTTALTAMATCLLLHGGPAPRVVSGRSSLQLNARRRAPALTRSTSKDADEGATDTGTPTMPTPPADVPVRPLSTFDEYGGYEAGDMPQLKTGELSEEEEAAAGDQGMQGASCLLVEDEAKRAEYEAQLQAMGDWKSGDESMREEQVLESVDGMVGNWEFQQGEKQREQQAAADDDYNRILAELAELETAAGAGGRLSAGDSGTNGAEVGEAAGVQDIE